MSAKFCSRCGTALIESSSFCSKCGASVTQGDTEFKGRFPKEDPTEWWYIVPILFGIIGGLIMYFAVKDDNKKMANEGLVIGIITMIIGIIIWIFIVGAEFSHMMSTG